MLDFWWRPLALVLGTALLTAFIWAWKGPVPALSLFSAVLLFTLLQHLRHLQRLDRWLAAPTQDPPKYEGIWGDVLYRLHKLLLAHRQAQASSHADLEHMQQATRLLPDGVVMLDAQNRIGWLNEAARQHLGLNPARDVGQYLTYLLRNTRFTTWLADPDGGSLTLPSPVGASRTLSLQWVPLPDGQRMLLSQDISELMRVDAMRRDFVANVSHELRTPITVINGFLEGFADMERPDPEEFRTHLGLMCEQAERIGSLVDDLLTLARLEADTEPQDEAVDVGPLLASLRNEAEGLSQGQHEIALEMKGEAQLRGGRPELHSALGNLVSNAVRYTPPGGRITLRWRITPSGSGEFSVSDTGEGIAAHHIPRLTERFYRVDRGRSRASGGTGLGLAIVKHVLGRHQGRLRVESTVGRGSTFTACFPTERVTTSPLPRERGRG